MKIGKIAALLVMLGAIFNVYGEKNYSENRPITAILTPEFRISDPPEYLSRDFHTLLESALIRNQVRVHNMQAVKEILRRRRIPDLQRATPAWYAAIGEVLQVDTLIQCTVTRFDVIETPFTVSETGASGVHRTGFMEGVVRVIATSTGEVLFSLPIEQEIDFRQLDRQVTRNWQIDDYYRFMIRNQVAIVVPELLKISALTEKSL